MQPRPATAFAHPLRVTWGDCDPAHIAYTARLPWFALDAIDAWWSGHLGYGGWFHMETDLKVGTPFVRLEMDFRAPVTPRHPLICHVWPVRLGTTSVTFRVDGEQDGTLCFEMAGTSVFMRDGAFAKAEPPDDIRALLMRHIPED